MKTAGDSINPRMYINLALVDSFPTVYA